MAFDDLALNEVTCCECHKPIPSIPPWLSSATVNFECEECRSKHPRMPGMELEPRRSTYAEADDAAEVGVAAEEHAEEEESDEPEEAEEYAE